MIGGVITWGVYSTLLKKKKFELPLLNFSSCNLYIWINFFFHNFFMRSQWASN